MDKHFGDLLIFLATIDPVTSMALFVGLTGNMPATERRRVAVRSIAYAVAVLIGFLVVGQLVLGGLGVRLESFQLAGGIIFFLFGVQMVFGTGAAADNANDNGGDIAIYPLAVPSLASPGSILACVVLTDNNEFTLVDQAATCGIMLAVMGGTLLLFLQADRVYRLIGSSGCKLMVRVLGLLLAALAVEMALEGAAEVVAALSPPAAG